MQGWVGPSLIHEGRIQLDVGFLGGNCDADSVITAGAKEDVGMGGAGIGEEKPNSKELRDRAIEHHKSVSDSEVKGSGVAPERFSWGLNCNSWRRLPTRAGGKTR